MEGTILLKGAFYLIYSFITPCLNLIYYYYFLLNLGTEFISGWDSIRGLSLKVLSKNFSPLKIEEEVEAFLIAQRESVLSMSEEDVQNHCTSLIKSLKDPPTSYINEAADFWEAIKNDFPFSWNEMLIEKLNTIDKKSLTDYLDQCIFNSDLRKAITVSLFGKNFVQDFERISNENFDDNQKSRKIFEVEAIRNLKDSLPYFIRSQD